MDRSLPSSRPRRPSRRTSVDRSATALGCRVGGAQHRRAGVRVRRAHGANRHIRGHADCRDWLVARTPLLGEGTGHQAAQAALRFGLIDCGLERVVSITQVGNNASERIVVKAGHAAGAGDGRSGLRASGPRIRDHQGAVPEPAGKRASGTAAGAALVGAVSFVVSYIHVYRRPCACTAGPLSRQVDHHDRSCTLIRNTEKQTVGDQRCSSATIANTTAKPPGNT
jgi:hypothetical protein